uniref:Uncharacterized protein n=1 Tax=Lactuca sativa TaxID=4236 RepID=A0A9R1UMH8_LACSA|nr:hypothetical protein LSAT_V11C800411010 [Lactuca sativa]
MVVEMSVRYLLLEHLRTMEKTFTGGRRGLWFFKWYNEEDGHIITAEDFGRNNCKALSYYFCSGDNSCFENVNHFGLAFSRMFGSTFGLAM